MYRCTRCASQRENGVKEKDGVTYKKSVKKDTETKQDKSKKIENEEVDCVAFCAIKEKGRELDRRNTEVSRNKYNRKREEKQNDYVSYTEI